MRAAPKILLFMLIIPFSFFIVSHLIPLFYGVYLSFTNREGQFIGLGNYIRLIDDYRFWGSIRFTFLYAIASALLNTFLGLLIGVFISSLKRGQGILKATFLIPWIIPLAIWGLEFRIIFSRDFGLLNYFLLSLGLIKEPIAWLGEATPAKLSVILVAVYRYVWYSALLFLVSCQNIPRDLYEAAEIDGATSFNMFLHITLPLLRRTMLFVGSMIFLGSLQAFDLIYALTYGGPGYATHTAALYIFRRSLHYGEFEYGTAISTVWALIIFCMVGTSFALLWKLAERR